MTRPSTRCRYSGNNAGTRFGKGNYFADEPCKSHGYGDTDADGSSLDPELKAKMFDGHSIKHPGNVRYIFVSRVVMGCYVRTDDTHRILNEGVPSNSLSCWDDGARHKELSFVQLQGKKEQFKYHGLWADVDQSEFIQFHDERTYPAFLVAYKDA